MNIGHLLLTIFVVQYTNYIIISILFNKKNRMLIQMSNKKLDKYRKKAKKTLEEQKEFINIKYPRTIGLFKFSWKKVLGFLFTIIKFVLMFKLWDYFLFEFLNLEFKIWHSLLIIVLLTFLINYILGKFNLQKSGLRELISMGGKNEK